MRAAWAKSADIALCGFSHSACGNAFSYRADWAGYRWSRLGENIAYGSGSPLPSARTIFGAWLRSGDVPKGGIEDVRAMIASTRFWVVEFGHH
jgi:hypothetical protein